MSNDFELNIANLSYLTENQNFLLQVSRKSDKLTSFIKDIPNGEKEWLSDLKSWEIKNRWLKDVSDVCIIEFDQVFFDMGEDLFDLKDENGYKDFRKRVLSKHQKIDLE